MVIISSVSFGVSAKETGLALADVDANTNVNIKDELQFRSSLQVSTQVIVLVRKSESILKQYII